MAARSRPRPPRPSLRAYAATWLLTLACALLVVMVGGPIDTLTHHLLRLRLDPHATTAPSAGRVLALAAHNLPIAAWPLLLGPAGACRGARGRRLGDALVAACIVVNVAPVGLALGAYGAPLLPYLPQLPLEWAALAGGAAAWVARRAGSMSLREGVARLCVIGVLVVSAALVETVAVPHV